MIPSSKNSRNQMHHGQPCVVFAVLCKSCHPWLSEACPSRNLEWDLSEVNRMKADCRHSEGTEGYEPLYCRFGKVGRWIRRRKWQVVEGLVKCMTKN